MKPSDFLDGVAADFSFPSVVFLTPALEGALENVGGRPLRNLLSPHDEVSVEVWWLFDGGAMHARERERERERGDGEGEGRVRGNKKGMATQDGTSLQGWDERSR